MRAHRSAREEESAPRHRRSGRGGRGAPEALDPLGELVHARGDARDLRGERVEPGVQRRALLAALGGLLAIAAVELAHHGLAVPAAAMDREGQRVEVLAELGHVLLQGLAGYVGASRGRGRA